MATKKQRKRRQKDRRHEWEYVYVDEEGREIAVAEEERRKEKDARAERGAKPRSGGPGRRIDPPSWRRVLRRAAIFAPLMFLFVYYTGNDRTVAGAFVFTVFLMAIFIPFSYFLDTMLYRAYRKRLGGTGDTPSKRR